MSVHPTSDAEANVLLDSRFNFVSESSVIQEILGGEIGRGLAVLSCLHREENLAESHLSALIGRR